MTDRERDEIEQVVKEMRMMARVAGQASVETTVGALADAYARFADYCTRWADRIEAVLRRSRAVPRDRSDAAHVAAAKCVCGHAFDRHTFLPDIPINYGTCVECERCAGFSVRLGEAAETRAVLPEPTCEWSIDDVSGDSVYETACKQAFEFNDGGPEANGFGTCPYCGRTLTVYRTSENEALSPDTDTAPSQYEEQ